MNASIVIGLLSDGLFLPYTNMNRLAEKQNSFTIFMDQCYHMTQANVRIGKNDKSMIHYYHSSS